MIHYRISLSRDGNALFTPKSLQQLCTQVCAAQAKCFFFVEEPEENGSNLRMKRDVSVSSKVLEQVLDNCEQRAPEYLPMMVELCRNVSLNRINLNNCELLTDSLLEQMMSVCPASLEINNCPNLTSRALDIINAHGQNLELLHLGNSARYILPCDLGTDLSPGMLNTPKLRHLTIWNIKFNHFLDYTDFLECLTRAFIGGLEHLELRGCSGIKSLEFLLAAKDTLTVLNLSHVIQRTFEIFNNRPSFVWTWDVLHELHNLRFLDVSYCNLYMGVRDLDSLVSWLPQLSHLDLSATYRDSGTTPPVPNASRRRRTKAFSSSRKQNPLDFVNLFFIGQRIRRNLVPARVLVDYKDKLFDDLIEAIKVYRGDGEFPCDMLDLLESISKQRMADDSRFPWMAAIDLVLHVAGANLDLYSSNTFFLDALEAEPPALALSQLDQILNWVIKALSRTWEYYSEKLIRLIVNIIPRLANRMDLWSPRNASRLVPALVRAGRTAVEGYRKGDGKYDTVLDHVGRYLCFDLSASCAAQIRTAALVQETRALVSEVMDVDTLPRNIAQLYATIQQKLVD